MKDIPKRYDPKEYEEKWSDFWVNSRVFSSRPDERDPYAIVIPPPNVTGFLHMGHALNNVLQDIIIRINKILGRNVLWMPGTDHGGIATQNVVEKMLLAEGKTRHDLGRDKFLERMWKWKEESGGTIINQLKRIGCGCDWDRLRFTMDDVCSAAVREAFVRLFGKNLIYRGKRMINWCPRCQTALADIEVEREEKDSSLWYIDYPLEDGSGNVTVATTRPETMLGDTAVAVNPKDRRYKKLIGRRVRLPLTDRIIPVVGDEFVDKSFGTGCVKVTPAHDPNDEEIGKRHGLDEVVVIDRDGRMTPYAGKSYDGLDRFDCRKKLVKDLKKKGYLKKIENYRHAPGICYRCDTLIEPLQQLQWFLKMEDIAGAAAEATRRNRVKFFPANWSKPYLNWLDNIKDWCLSRQIWWGHRMPIWYCGKCDGDKILIYLRKDHEALLKLGKETESIPRTDGFYSELIKEGYTHKHLIEFADTIHVQDGVNPLVALEQPAGCPSCGSSELIQDPDVLDTWFSSALWPFSTFGWPEDSEDLKYYYPTEVLVTGHEILYLWVARMVMMGLEMIGDIPYRSVYIHGIIRDEHGNKMSKSKGNVIDPLKITDVYGTDSLRFALAKSAVPGRDIQLSEDDFVGARNFCNKLWNATRLILGTLKLEKIEIPVQDSMQLADKWIIHQSSDFIKRIKEAYLDFNNALAARLIYEFVWKYFCDWYLEIAKLRLYSNNAGEKRQVESVLLHVLTRILGALHPIMPFISSQLWSYIAEDVSMPAGDILEFNAFDTPDPRIDRKEVKKMDLLMEIVSGIRNIRGEMEVPPSAKLNAKIKADGGDAALVKQHLDYLKLLGGLDTIDVGHKVKRDKTDAVAAVGRISVYLSLSEDIIRQEKERLSKKITDLQQQVGFSNKKLKNRDFVEKAKEEVVQKVKDKLEKDIQELQRLEKTLEEMNR
ncbi:MAG: valine--tRNA ligase [Elusimicrobia bacterium]|nr:valine--tRNA ligase [Elusimicrobiota bacterium]